MKASIGHVFVPYWMGMAGERVRIHKGCKHGAPKNTKLRPSLEEVAEVGVWN